MECRKGKKRGRGRSLLRFEPTTADSVGLRSNRWAAGLLMNWSLRITSGLRSLHFFNEKGLGWSESIRQKGADINFLIRAITFVFGQRTSARPWEKTAKNILVTLDWKKATLKNYFWSTKRFSKSCLKWNLGFIILPEKLYLRSFFSVLLWMKTLLNGIFCYKKFFS